MRPDTKRLLKAVLIAPWASLFPAPFIVLLLHVFYGTKHVAPGEFRLALICSVLSVVIAYGVVVFAGVPLYLLAKRFNKAGYGTAIGAAAIICPILVGLEVVHRVYSWQEHHDGDLIYQLKESLPHAIWLFIHGVCVAIVFIWIIKKKPLERSKVSDLT